MKGNQQTSKGDVTRFSTASTTPSFVLKPMAEEGQKEKQKSNLDGLDGVLDLEQPPLGGEGVDSSIILGPSKEQAIDQLLVEKTARRTVEGEEIHLVRNISTDLRGPGRKKSKSGRRRRTLRWVLWLRRCDYKRLATRASCDARQRPQRGFPRQIDEW
ncbi:hypothetical protein GW17_00016040 [Ensete ventricosum]|nr:hypothetical protein GW17_00016040 [Ensete ventricosum]RZR83962.1 hypothetical protein BHM03_00010688 [Ensete ventricosum]